MGDHRLYEKVAPVEKGFPIKFTRGNGTFPIHWHEYIEMLYCLNDGKVFCNGKSYDMRKGDITIVNSAELHSTIEGDYYCLRIAPSFFSDVDTAECYFVNYIPRDTELSDCFEAVFREYNEKGVGYDIEVKSIVYHLIRLLLVKYANNKNPKNAAPANPIKATGLRIGLRSYLNINVTRVMIAMGTRAIPSEAYSQGMISFFLSSASAMVVMGSLTRCLK